MNDAYITMGCYLAVHNPKHFLDIIKGDALVPSLDGSGKMSKTGNPKHTIFLHDTKEIIRQKISKIPSDPEHWHVFFGLNWVFLSEKEKQKLVQAIESKLRKDIKSLSGWINERGEFCDGYREEIT